MNGFSVRIDPSFRFNHRTVLKTSYEKPETTKLVSEMMVDMHKKLIIMEDETIQVLPIGLGHQNN